MSEKATVHGFSVIYEENAIEGIRYLVKEYSLFSTLRSARLRDDLDFEEARVFFDQARTKGFAEFEDDEDRQYTLFYKGGSYTLARR